MYHQNKRLEILDVARFLAAISVVFYHYLYRGWTSGEFIDIDFGQYEGLFKYGYLGVQFFFLISGFVICMSSEGKTTKEFLWGRVIRLYPAYWVCLLITLAFIYFLDDGRFYIFRF